ncbi:collagen binding domain-containing protein [Fibrobacterota bacterium]
MFIHSVLMKVALILCSLGLDMGLSRSAFPPYFQVLRRKAEGLKPQVWNRRPSPQPLARQAGKKGAGAGGGGSLSGEVLEEDGSPADGYRISILDTFGFQVYEEYQSQSAWQAAGLYPGSYRVRAFKSDQRVFSLTPEDAPTWYPRAVSYQSASWVSVSEGQSVTDINITMLPDDLLTLAITGTCYLGPGMDSAASLKSFTMNFVDAVTLERAASEYLFADSDGSFTGEIQIHAGDFYVMTASSGYLDRWLDGGGLENAPIPVSITGNVLTAEIHLLEGAVINGTIQDRETGVLQESVTISLLDQDGYVMKSVYLSNRDSSFSLEGLYSGSYYLKIGSSFNGYHEYYHGPGHPGELITIGDMETVTLDLSAEHNNDVPGLTETGTINGTVTSGTDGTPVYNATVNMEWRRETSGSTTRELTYTDELGRYTDAVSADFPYAVMAEPPLNEYYLSPTWYPGTLLSEEAAIVTVSLDQTQTADIAMKAAGSLGGFLLDNGLPIDFSTVYASSNTEVSFPELIYMLTIVDNSGVPVEQPSANMPGLWGGYRVPGLPAGAYRVFGFPYFLKSPSQQSGYTAFRTDNVVVSNGQTTLAAPVELPRASGGITGNVPQSAAGPTGVLCLDENGYFAGLYVNLELALTGDPDDTNILHKFYNRDSGFLDELSGTSSYGPYYINYLEPGRYALASLQTHEASGSTTLTWYDEVAQTFPSDSILSTAPFPLPGEVTWITVGEGQTVTDINFSAAPVRPPDNTPDDLGGICLLNNPVRDKAILTYRLPASPGRNNHSTASSLRVFTGAGRIIREIPLEKNQGTVTLKLNGPEQPAAAPGIYYFRIKQGETVYTARGVVLE